MRSWMGCARAKWLPDAQALGKKPAQQSYAAGVALGRDIQTMLAERKIGASIPIKPCCWRA
ncbi:hypothetical protein M5585_14300 [Serratia ureilytica]